MDFFYFEDFNYYVHQIQFDLRKYKNNFNGELKKKGHCSIVEGSNQVTNRRGGFNYNNKKNQDILDFLLISY